MCYSQRKIQTIWWAGSWLLCACALCSRAIARGWVTILKLSSAIQMDYKYVYNDANLDCRLLFLFRVLAERAHLMNSMLTRKQNIRISCVTAMGAKNARKTTMVAVRSAVVEELECAANGFNGKYPQSDIVSAQRNLRRFCLLWAGERCAAGSRTFCDSWQRTLSVASYEAPYTRLNGVPSHEQCLMWLLTESHARQSAFASEIRHYYDRIISSIPIHHFMSSTTAQPLAIRAQMNCRPAQRQCRAVPPSIFCVSALIQFAGRLRRMVFAVV